MDCFTVTALDRVMAAWEPTGPVPELDYDLLGPAGKDHAVPAEIDQIYLRCRITIEAMDRKNAVGAYDRLKDVVCMPAVWARFKHPDDLWLTLLHEAIHWTGHKKRLDRMEEVYGSMFGWSPGYCREEAVAQIGALLVLDALRITTERHIQLTQDYVFYFIKYGWADPAARHAQLRRAISQARYAAIYLLRRARFHAEANRVYGENGVREDDGDSLTQGDLVPELVTGQVRTTTL